jgi:hypothetical protein
MTRVLGTITGAAMLALGLSPAFAQVPGLLPPPDLQNRIPEPLPPPPKPLAVPLGEKGPQPGVYQPPRLRTQSDRTVDCVQQGSEAGLRGGKLDTYTRRCANAN